MNRTSDLVIKKSVILAISTILVATIWFLVCVPEFEKIPDEFHLYLEQEGKDQIANSINGELSNPFKLKESLIQKAINSDGNFITISSVISGRDEFAEKEIFHLDEKYEINVYDYTYKEDPNKRFWFKPGVQKQDYQFYHPLVFANTPLVYQKTEKIEDLDTYVFRAITSKNDISDRLPQFSGVTILSDTTSDFWIEPITGNLVKFEKNWEDYTIGDNQEKTILQKGGKKTTEYSVFILSDIAKHRIENINFYTKIIPTLLMLLTIVINLIIILRVKIRQINEKLRRNEKLAVIGTFAARLAHDLRNPLTVMKAQLGIMALEKTQDEKIVNGVARLSGVADRMNRQINEIIDFVKEKPLKIEKFQSNKLVESALSNTLIPERIKVILPEVDIPIHADFTQIETVLSNIITNAIQAIEKSGTITISIKENSDTVMLSISDSGPGIPKQDMDEIFEPLFTTKQNGTGLGLSSCKTIMENHRGKITVQNNPTTFTLHIPKKQPNLTVSSW